MMIMSQKILVGVDVGSTTTKVAVLDQSSHKLLYSDYRRHHADQKRSVLRVINELYQQFHDAQILPLDYDPDVSFANIENRLQMLIMNIKERQAAQGNVSDSSVPAAAV